MANTIAIAQGFQKDEVSPQNRATTRLGNGAARAQANTWRTFTTCHVRADGSGYVRAIRDGVVLYDFSFGPE